MAREFLASLDASGRRFGVVASRYSRIVTDRLVGGLLECLRQHGVSEDAVDIVWVPGSFEIPLVAQKLAASGRYDAVIALGVVIQGATSHAQQLNAEVSKGLAQISLQYGLPVIYGVVTTENLEQAIERSGTKAGNRGATAAQAAIEMANLMRTLPAAKK